MTDSRTKISPIERLVTDKMGVKKINHLKELELFQMEQLRKQMYYAKENSAFYAKQFKDVNIEKILSYADLNQIPLMSEKDIYQYGPEMACLPLHQIPRFTTIRSSGTSGPAKQLYFTEKDLRKVSEFFTYGVQSGMYEARRVLIYLPGLAYGSIAHLITVGLQAIEIETYTFGAISDYEEAVKVYREFQADCVIGLPSQILQLAKTAPELKPGLVFITADYIPDSLVSALSQIWQCEVLSHYGSTECGLAGAVECSAHQGYHIRHQDLLFEVIDPDTTSLLPYHQWGEIVFSTLNREGMPIIRYRTGDIGSLLSEPCSCGGILPRLSKIKGRWHHQIQVGSTALSIQQLDELMFSLPQVLDYQVVFRDNILFFSVKSKEKELRGLEEKIKHALPGIPFLLSLGEGFYTTGTVKRKIIVE